MTRAEFYAKYGDVHVCFDSYYKYTFTYGAKMDDGSTLVVEYGGDSDHIYRHEVSALSVEKVADLQPYAGRVYKDGAETDSFYDF